MKTNALLLALSMTFLLLCPTARAATLSRFTMTDTVDEVSRAPLGSTQVFKPNTPRIWATTYLENGEAQDTVSSVWEYFNPSTGEYTYITKTAITADGTRYVAFSLEAQGDPAVFPETRYRARIFLNSEEQAVLYFNVGDIQAMLNTAETPAPQTDSAQPAQARSEDGFMLYSDPEGRFRVELPGTWFPAEPEGNIVLYLSHNKNSDPVATVAVNVHPAEITSVFNRSDAIVRMRDTLIAESKDIGAEIVKDQFSESDNPKQNAWLLFFRYEGPNGQTIEDRKVVFCPGRHVFVLSSMVASDAKDRFIKVFERFINSFEALE